MRAAKRRLFRFQINGYVWECKPQPKEDIGQQHEELINKWRDK